MQIERQKPLIPAAPLLYTVPEAAWVAHTSDQTVNREVDQKVVRIEVKQGKRLFAEWDLFYLCAVSPIVADVSVRLRRRIYTDVRLAFSHPEEVNGRNDWGLAFGRFRLDLAGIRAELGARIHEVEQANACVHSDPSIRGGEPVIRGTRIPVRALGEMSRAGTGNEELAEEYDISTRQVELALLYDKLYPKKGRPFSKSTAIELSDLGRSVRKDVEVLGVYKKP